MPEIVSSPLSLERLLEDEDTALETDEALVEVELEIALLDIEEELASAELTDDDTDTALEAGGTLEPPPPPPQALRHASAAHTPNVLILPIMANLTLCYSPLWRG